MNQKGFATILGLCLILALALVVKGIQESDMNHSYETTDFQTELELQNAAESKIYEAAEKVRTNPNLLPVCKDVYSTDPRKKMLKEIPLQTANPSSDSISVKVWGERIVIKPYDVNYARKTNNKYNTYPFVNQNKNIGLKVCAFFSVATLTDKRTGENLYRHAYAYFVESNIKERGGNVSEEIPVSAAEKKIIHFMEVSNGNLHYMKTNNPDRK